MIAVFFLKELEMLSNCMNLLTSMKRHRVKMCRHITQSSGLTKTILQGAVQEEGEEADRGDEFLVHVTSSKVNLSFLPCPFK